MNNKGDIHDCELIVPWESSYKFYLSMAMKKGHVHFHVMNMLIKRIEESGVLQKVKNKHFLKIENCDGSKVSNLGMEKLISIFVFLAIGGIFSLVLMLSEYIHTKYKSRHQMHWTSRGAPRRVLGHQGLDQGLNENAMIFLLQQVENSCAGLDPGINEKVMIFLLEQMENSRFVRK